MKRNNKWEGILVLHFVWFVWFFGLTCCNFWQHLFGNCYYSDCCCIAPLLAHYAIVVTQHGSAPDELPSLRRHVIDCQCCNWRAARNSSANCTWIGPLDWWEWSRSWSVANHSNYCYCCQHRAFGCRRGFGPDPVSECCEIPRASSSVWHPSVVTSTTWSYILVPNWLNGHSVRNSIGMRSEVPRLLVWAVQLKKSMAQVGILV